MWRHTVGGDGAAPTVGATPRGDFGGVGLSLVTGADVRAALMHAVATRTPVDVTFANPDYVRRAFRSDDLRRAIDGFDLVLVDGNGVRWLAPIFGFRVPERLDTDSLLPDILRDLAHARGRVFLFGCAPGVAELAGERIAAACPGLTVAGAEHGFCDVERGHPGRFDPADTARIIADIGASRADILVVSLPTPLQQRWVREHRDEITVPVVITGGSVLDHVAESATWPGSWYPDWANRWALNWFYRLCMEPRRLWRRYTIEIVEFTVASIRRRVTGGTARLPRPS